MKEILSIWGLSKSYKHIKAVQNLNLEISEGQSYGILGPNGSGKTTTLSIVTGILRQNAGTFSWFGEEPYPGQRRSIGSLIEIPHFYPYLNLEKNLRIICDIKGQGYSDIDRVLESAKLLGRKRSRFSTMSLGMKQRLGLAAALLGDPRVLVLDEPTNGLDPEGIAEVREMVLDQVKEGKTLIFASHILSEVEKICSHVAILKKGELLANGPVKELLSEEEIIEVSCSDNSTLADALKGAGMATETSMENGLLILTLKDGVTPAKINSFAFTKQLVISHMVSRKRSLESQFLELVKQEEG
ncbi:MAG: ATP-binding cassette domain-containing protein [Bacteroidetes bacterium]|nr:ATP-binding cassette domain-containing protein [Bacteroidota bacterium]